MKGTLRRLVLGVALMAGVLPRSASAEAASPARIRLVVFPGGFNWPIWVAEEQGFFAANGVAVDVTPTPSSVYQMTRLIDGTFDLAMTAVDNVVAYDEGQGEAKVASTPDLVAVMGGDDGFLRLVTDPSVPSYPALKGKELTVDALTTGYAFVLREMLKQVGRLFPRERGRRGRALR